MGWYEYMVLVQNQGNLEGAKGQKKKAGMWDVSEMPMTRIGKRETKDETAK